LSAAVKSRQVPVPLSGLGDQYLTVSFNDGGSYPFQRFTLPHNHFIGLFQEPGRDGPLQTPNYIHGLEGRMGDHAGSSPASDTRKCTKDGLFGDYQKSPSFCFTNRVVRVSLKRVVCGGTFVLHTTLFFGGAQNGATQGQEDLN